ncbi:MAG: 6-carboxytetrahydropterin synthase QueD [Elusimicrobiota bacterium]
MYEIYVESTFSSAHKLKNYKGKCENLHGHNYRVQVYLRGSMLDKAGLGVDFQDLKTKLNTVLNTLDHRYLNNTPGFRKKNPSAENIAEHIFQKLKNKVMYNGYKLHRIAVWEGEKTAVTYFGEQE